MGTLIGGEVGGTGNLSTAVIRCEPNIWNDGGTGGTICLPNSIHEMRDDPFAEKSDDFIYKLRNVLDLVFSHGDPVWGLIPVFWNV